MRRDRLIGDLYEAALRQDGYLDVMQRVAEWVGADIFHMFSIDTVHNIPHFSLYTPNDVPLNRTVAQYDQYYRALDPRTELVTQQPSSEWFACQNSFDEHHVSRSEFFQDFLIPNGIRYTTGTRIALDNRDDVYLGLMRAAGRKPFSANQLVEVRAMGAHLQRAISLWQDARELHRYAAVAVELTEQMDLAVFALDRNFRTQWANRGAERMLRATVCLKLQNGRLIATSSTQNDCLQAAMARVLKTRKGESCTLYQPPQGKHEIFLNIAALSGGCLKNLFGDSALLVTARRRDDVRLVTALQLRQAFGLTAAEASAAEALIDGQTPDEYATLKRVALATVRTQLRAIYEKTRTRSQAEAVGVMLWVISNRSVDGAEV